MLTLQADSIIIIFLDPSGLSSYFLAAKIVSVFAFFSSLGLPRVFSSVAENGVASVISSQLSKYSALSWAVPIISFLSTVCYLSWAGLLSANAAFVAILLSLTLSLRILTDLYSCVLQSVGLSRELILYLPAQAILTVVLGFLLGRFYGSIGVAVSQFAGFALVAYPWLRSVFRKKLSSVKT
jgi:O-antigen/teichoic acid export membrane protein